MEGAAALEVEDVRCELAGLQILTGVNLSAAEGETVGIIGPNGSGKTTLFNCISGFAPVTSGTIKLNGSEITRRAPHQRSLGGLGRVFQNSGVFREMSLLDNVVTAIEGRIGLRKTFFPWSGANARVREEAMEYLRRVNLDRKAKERAGGLSGGQLRLLEITRTLAFGARVFLLDEPTAGVAPKMKEQLAELIRSLKAEKKTVLVIEHDITFIEQFCDRIAVLDVGRTVLDGVPELVKHHPLLREIYFGVRA